MTPPHVELFVRSEGQFRDPAGERCRDHGLEFHGLEHREGIARVDLVTRADHEPHDDGRPGCADDAVP